MRYPKLWRKIVNALALISGLLALLTGFLSVFEAVSRYFFHHPTSWSLTITQYILLYLVFFASPYAFQECGHVAIDIARSAADKIEPTGRLRKCMAVFGYIAAMVFIAFLFKAVWAALMTALQHNKMTLSIPIVPMWVLYVPMLIGLALMAITIIFMILDILSRNGTGKYI